jgi:thiamine kinase-like enzyme
LAAFVAQETFRAIAQVHATFWKQDKLFLRGEADYSWLRGKSWLLGQGRDSWEASQRIIQQIWSAYCAKEEQVESSSSSMQWDPVVRAATAKAITGISWEKQLDRLNERGHWTLVHGDFWPGNVMWKGGDFTAIDDQNPVIRLLDWEMVGLGSGPQDLGQYALSNMDPVERRACERQLIEVYYSALCQAGVNEKCEPNNRVTLDYCWKEYMIGGLERWLWFLVYFLGQDSLLDWAQFFHNQIAAFMKDHGLSECDITQPRP